jgi:cytochrome b pre-mRNA-processing protein 3
VVLIEETQKKRGLSPGARHALAWLIGVLALGLALAIAWYADLGLDRELSSLPVPERKALYERTRQTLLTVCSQPHGAELEDHCREQAHFILRFPECDRACRELAERFAPNPTR